jgi:hypothetical protein
VRVTRLVAAVAAIVASALLALLAADVRAWTDHFAVADSQLKRSAGPLPARKIDSAFPLETARRILEVDDDVQLRRGIWLFKQGRAARDREQSARAYALSAGELNRIAASASRREASQAQNLIGLIAYYSASTIGFDRNDSVAAFARAVRLDPANVDAKYNLELVLRAIRADQVYQSQIEAIGRGSGKSRSVGGARSDSPLLQDY